MPIRRLHIEGYKRFKSFDIELNPTFNTIVGDNETGKTSLLEAIGLVLTGLYGGRMIQYALDPFMFHLEAVQAFFHQLRKDVPCATPRILIEAYLAADSSDPDLSRLSGRNNSRSEDCPGLKLEIAVDSDHCEALKEYAKDKANPEIVPVEYFRARWTAFSGNPVNTRRLPFRAALIDTSIPKAHYGPTRYVSEVVRTSLGEEQRRDLALAYRRMRHDFARQPGVQAINSELRKQGNAATSRDLTIKMDMSSRSSWEGAIAPHIDDLPIECIGKGEQCCIQIRLAIAGTSQSRVLLIEEPENHLSHSNLNRLMVAIKENCPDRQVVLTTHSTFVLNKLGIDMMHLVSRGPNIAVTLNALDPSTRDYFMKLPGYDTLRMLLSNRCLLVEGPSDELIVQRAYHDAYGRLPLDDGIDVISVGSLAFKRFLEIARLLDLDVRVITDNDGDVAALEQKYADYLGNDTPTIKVCYPANERCSTLEPQLLDANDLHALNSILGRKDDRNQLLRWMKNNKTRCALKLFETCETWHAPEYIVDAIRR